MKLLVADDHTLFRDGLATLLEAAGLQVIGQVGLGEAAVTAALALRPDVILVDMSMPDLSGLEALRRIRAAWPEAQVVVLTDAEDDTELLDVVDAGGRGYLSKNLNAEEFIRMLHGLERGDAETLGLTRQEEDVAVAQEWRQVVAVAVQLGAVAEAELAQAALGGAEL
ncbi:MAG TPA: response regulator transcription factor, partial [Anaerolineales bacterium]|nr:response regulator transcription factor [Anaerolineales bacterium]